MVQYRTVLWKNREQNRSLCGPNDWQKLSLHKAADSMIYGEILSSHVEFSQNKFK